MWPTPALRPPWPVPVLPWPRARSSLLGRAKGERKLVQLVREKNKRAAGLYIARFPCNALKTSERPGIREDAVTACSANEAFNSMQELCACKT